MYANDKFAGFPPVHPIARHENIKAKCQQLAEAVPASELKGVWQRVVTGFRNWQKRRTDRHAFQHMITLDDPILRDIGVTKADVIWASRLPLSVNAAVELEKVARQNKRMI